MKSYFPIKIDRLIATLAAGMLFLFLPSCHDEVTSTHTFRTMMPVYLEMSNVRAKSIEVVPPQELENPGKIYIYGDYLFVNEPQKGIHILDNSNPANPVNLNFIEIEGNVDLAINSGILYADSYVDLLAFDIQDIRNVKLENRVEDVFKHMYYHDTGIILTWKDTVITAESNQIWHWRSPWGFAEDSRAFTNMASSNTSQSYGQGGSMARFTLMSGHLYAVDESSLRVFDVTEKKLPKHLKNIDLGWGIETIFPFQEKLFIGSNTGMHIYDAKVPSDPKELAVYQHILACDPVVVNEKHAFVTLRKGVNCNNGVNELHVVDIQNPRNPTLLKSYPMYHPHGLSLTGDYLYVAEGKYGLKSFDVRDVMQIDRRQLEFLESMKSVDIIAGPKSLIVIGPDGVCQFDYSTPSVLKPLSCIQVKNPVVV